MPKAVATQETFRRDLQSLPEAFVELRKLSYGEILRRRELSSKLQAPMSAVGRRRRNDNKDDGEPEVTFYMAIVDTQHFDFSKCIVDHNLEDEKGKKLNFQSHQDIVRLDPKVAQEIEFLIDDLNQPAELTPFENPSGEPSPQVEEPETSQPA